MNRRLLLCIIFTISSNYAIHPDEFAQRRGYVRTQLSSNSAMIIFTSETYPRNSDVDHEFRPDSDFWYLSGYPEPEGVLIIINDELSLTHQLSFDKEAIFVRPRNAKAEVWTGRRIGVETVKRELGFEFVFASDSLKEIFNSVLPFIDTLFINQQYPPHKNKFLNQHYILQNMDLGEIAIQSSGKIIHPLRHIKSNSEVDLLQQAIDITGKGLIQGILRAKPTLTERQVQATIEFMFRDEGSNRLGFPSIIAAGPNATILHYTENSAELNRGELLLMDVGAEYQMYTADITRTIPINGKFNPTQKWLYNEVLNAQKTAFDSVKIGITLKDLHRIAKNYLKINDLDKYFIHGLGHWLGLDVHDVGGKTSSIKVGSVFTIEPGIYIQEDDTTASEEMRGIGIRIEDDVLMTKTGPVWLSSQVPKEVEEIERLMRRRSRIFKLR